MKVVKFNRTHLMYQRGETAGFPDDHADKLIAAGIARDPNAPMPELPADVAAQVGGDEPGASQGGQGEEGGEPKAGEGAGSQTDTAADAGAPPVQGKGRK
ncbi:hypothetical protein PVT71_18315 [Salipiger sp. H15]|uniref:Mu-like prophage FluMu N-terminal domain-containing protein n=1 Tax=Alloyangia sp. H15 TaxID=3029062 RepID=A0AAU8APS2_9RHOB